MIDDTRKTREELVAELESLRKKVAELADDRTREELRESEERYRIVTEISRDAIEVVDEEGFTIFVNPAVEEIFGYTPEDCFSKKFRDWLDVVHPDDLERVSEEYRRVEKRAETVYYEPMRVRCKDGRWVWVTAVATSYLSACGQRRILEVSRDITEQVEAEQRQHRVVEERKEAQRLESLGLMAGGIAHDFNNILVSVLGYADMALHKLQPFSPLRPMIENIMKGGERAADLCSQLLAYSGKRQLAVGAIDLNAVVNEISQLVEASISKKVTLKYQLAEELPAIEVEASQIPQVAMNLIVNASEAIGDDVGIIRVSTGVVQLGDGCRETVCFPGDEIARGDYVYVEVSDTGCGMDEETRARIFDPFFSTKFTGRGLGLATVLGIVRAHEGVIELESELAKGTTIRVLFPAMQRSVEPRAREVSATDAWRGTGTILLVDDEAAILEIGALMLESAGFDVRKATDGPAAVETYRQHQGEIVCVVLDVMMPKLDGEETYRELKRIREDVKVVFSSGFHEQDVRERLSATGIAGFLKKPYTADAFIGTVRRALDEGDS